MEEDDDMEALWPIITVAGPILLVIVVLWAMMRNRAAGRSNEARADEGARRVYADEDRRTDD